LQQVRRSRFFSPKAVCVTWQRKPNPPACPFKRRGELLVERSAGT
jgi:hypothetical protein